MNIKKVTIATMVCALAMTGMSCVLQAQYNQGYPAQPTPRLQNRVYGQPVQRGSMQRGTIQRQQPQQTQYYNVTLSEEQKSMPHTGASFSDTGGGISVRSVYTNSPAQKAGLNSGDLVTKVNGQPIRNVSTFNAMVARMKAGDSLTFTKKNRANQVKDVSCQLSTMGEILKASIVPEAGVYDQAVVKAEQALKSMAQEIKNYETELQDLKTRYASAQKRIGELRAKAQVEREQENRRKAAAEARRQKRIVEMNRKAEEAAGGN